MHLDNKYCWQKYVLHGRTVVKPLAQQRSEADSAVFGGDTVIVIGLWLIHMYLAQTSLDK